MHASLSVSLTEMSCYQAELLLNRKTKLSNKRNWSFIFSEWVIVSIKYNTYMYTIGSWTKSQRNMCSSLCLLTPHISTEEITSNKSSWQWSVLFRICQILFLYRETLLLHYFQSNKQTRRQALPFQNRKLKPKTQVGVKGKCIFCDLGELTVKAYDSFSIIIHKTQKRKVSQSFINKWSCWYQCGRNFLANKGY